MINILLVIVAITLFVPCYILNMIVVFFIKFDISGFFRSTAISIDRYGNYEFRTLFNLLFIKKKSVHKFGDFEHTISYVLGKNKEDKTLSKVGIAMCAILNFLDKKHVEKSVLYYNNKNKL